MAIVRNLTLTITLCLALFVSSSVAQQASFFAAARTGGVTSLQTLVSAGFDVNGRDQYGQTPLMYAAAGNPDPEVISYLVSVGADVNAITPTGWTALMFAARDNSNRAVAARLFELGADLDARNNQGLRAEDYAVASTAATSATFNVNASVTGTSPVIASGLGMVRAGFTGFQTVLPSSFDRQRAINYYSPAPQTSATGFNQSYQASFGRAGSSYQSTLAPTMRNVPMVTFRAYPEGTIIPANTSTGVQTQAVPMRAAASMQAMQAVAPSMQQTFAQAPMQQTFAQAPMQAVQPQIAAPIASAPNFYTPVATAATNVPVGFPAQGIYGAAGGNIYTNVGSSSDGFTNISSVGRQAPSYYGTRLYEALNAGHNVYAPSNVIYNARPVNTLRNVNESSMVMAQSPGIATPLFDIPADNGVQPPAGTPEMAPSGAQTLPMRRTVTGPLTQPSRLLYGPNGPQGFFYQPYALTYTIDYGREFQYNRATPVVQQIAADDFQPCVDLNNAAAPALLQIAHINTPAQIQDITIERGYQLFSSVEDLAARVSGIGPSQLADIRMQGLACVRFD